MGADLERAAAGMFAVGFEGPSVPPELRQLIARGVAGAVLFRRNYLDARQLWGFAPAREDADQFGIAAP